MSRHEALLLAWDRVDDVWLGLATHLDDQDHPITGWLTGDRITPAA